VDELCLLYRQVLEGERAVETHATAA
jgi:hypothetical protein